MVNLGAEQCMGIDEHELAKLDLGRCSLKLGTKLPKGKEPWLALDCEDWQILYKLLTSSIGDEKLRPAAHSQGLYYLSRFAENAIAWMRRNEG